MNTTARFTERLLRWLARRQPATRQRLGAVLARLGWWLVGRRRKIALRNLELCFPELTPAQHRRLGQQHFRALAQSIVDRSVLWYGSREQVQELVELVGVEHMHEGLRRGPVVLLAPHFVGLDAGASRLSIESPAVSMYQVQSNPGIDDIFRRGRRRFNDIRLISRREGLRGLLRHMKEGLPVYYLPDMDFGRKVNTFVPFFGVPAATLTTPAQLAANWQAQILPVLTYWNPATGRYRTEVHPPLSEFPGEQTLLQASERLNHEIEAWIRRAPAQYHWVHKRFKTRPPGEPDLYDPPPA